MVDAIDLSKASLYIATHLEEELSLGHLAESVGLSRFRFHRVFKAWRGETLHDFVTRLRMERAALELAYPLARCSKRTVKAIALASGYKSLSSFSHAFSSYSGMAPRAYRYAALQQRTGTARSTTLRRLGAGRQIARSDDVLFQPLTLTVAATTPRELAIIESRGSPVSGLKPLALDGIPCYAVESVAYLFAMRQRMEGAMACGSPFSGLAVDASVWTELARRHHLIGRDARRLHMQMPSARAAHLNGKTSLRQLHRVLRQTMDAWFLASHEAPRADFMTIEFPKGRPKSVFDVVDMHVVIPLEARIERRQSYRDAPASQIASLLPVLA